MVDESSKAKGGHARAAALSSDQRQEIAAKAAAARYGIPVATHTGDLEIGGSVIPCAVLENGVRVLSEHGVAQSLGSRSGASKRSKYAAQAQGRAPLPLFLSPKLLEPFIDQTLVGSSRVDLQACKLEYSIVSPK